MAAGGACRDAIYGVCLFRRADSGRRRFVGRRARDHALGRHALATRYGAKPEPDKRIVESGKLVTAAGVSAGIDLALHLVAKLLDPERAKIAQLLIEYDPQPPFDSGHMRKAQADIARKAKARMSRIAMTNPRNLISIPKLLTRQWRT